MWPGCGLNPDHSIRVVVKTTPLPIQPRCYLANSETSHCEILKFESMSNTRLVSSAEPEICIEEGLCVGGLGARAPSSRKILIFCKNDLSFSLFWSKLILFKSGIREISGGIKLAVQKHDQTQARSQKSAMGAEVPALEKNFLCKNNLILGLF